MQMESCIKNKNTQLRFWRYLIIAGVLSCLLSVQAMDLDLTTVPLELAPSAPPNVLLLSDSTESMDWEVLLSDVIREGKFNSNFPDGAFPSGFVPGFATITQRLPDAATPTAADANCIIATPLLGGPFLGGYVYGVTFPSNSSTVPAAFVGGGNCYTADDDAWRFRSYTFNRLYFNPNETYEPWPGVDINGVPFGPADITNAPDDPYNPMHFIDLTVDISGLDTAGNRIAGTGLKYYDAWVDSNGNGLADDAEMPTEHLISTKDTATQQNFANWFTYYRKKEFLVKAMLANLVVGNSSARVGYSNFDPTDSIGTLVALLEQAISTVDKAALLDAIYSTDSVSEFSIRGALAQAGAYFECTGSDIFGNPSSSPGDPTCPVLDLPAGSCQRNEIILVTDGFEKLGFSAIGNADGDNNTTFDGGAFADGIASTVADVTMHFYERNLHPTLANNVPANTADRDRDPTAPFLTLASKLPQHVKTNIISISRNASSVTFPSDPTTSFSWTNHNPPAPSGEFFDGLVHAAYNGRGSYFNVRDVSELDIQPDAIFTAATSVDISASALAFGASSSSEVTLAFRSFARIATNSGDLVAQVTNADGSFAEDASGDPIFAWSAANVLTNRVSPRVVITYANDGSANGGREFDFNAVNGLTAAQKTALNAPTPASIAPPDVMGERRTDYLRGDRTFEGIDFQAGDLRIRPPLDNTTPELGGILGDISGSVPIFVGEPPFSNRFAGAWPSGDDSYALFQEANRTRDPLVFVAANDGLLHAFDFDDGDEKFAYVPDEIIKDLSFLTNPEYTHRFYVDGTPRVNDVYIDAPGAPATQTWETILVGGLGLGGKGYYALRITDPTEFDTQVSAKDQVLWEFSESDDDIGGGTSDLGFSFGEPVIAMSNAVSGGEQRWVVIFGNGYNSTSASGDAVIYILFIEDGLDGVWSASDFVKINTGNGIAESADGTRNGIGDIRAIDTDGNGTVDRMYAGDLQGNVYVIDISSNDPDDWDDSSNTDVLFEARYGAGFPRTEVQPIINGPAVIKHPDEVGYIVMVATGSWITKQDASTDEIQSVYGLWDDLSDANLPIEMNSVTSELVKQEFTNNTLASGDEVRTVSNNFVAYNNSGANQVRGWHIDLDVLDASSNVEFPGERAIRKLILLRGQLFFTTVFPHDGESCDPPPGGFLLSVDPVTGGTGGEVIFDINNDGFFNADDNLLGVASIDNIIVGTRFDSTPGDIVVLGDRLNIPLTSGDVEGFDTNPRPSGLAPLMGRHSWKQFTY